jgi:hypothetical protein
MNVVQKISTATSAAEKFYAGMARPPVFGSSREEREHRKQRLRRRSASSQNLVLTRVSPAT